MTQDASNFDDATRFATHLADLRATRKRLNSEVRAAGRQRQRLGRDGRKHVLEKTGRHCHICGGKIDGDWDADHVLAHSHGGARLLENYLPAHKVCNNYRWFYGTEEFQWILKLGVWFRTRIERRDARALALVEAFLRHDSRRQSRRKKRTGTKTR